MAETMTKPKTSAVTQNPPLRQEPETKEMHDHSEGVVARTLEEQTAKLPSDIWLWASLGSMGVSLFLHASGKRQDGLFVGQWAAPFLLIGVYNKLVKVAGSDRVHK